MERCFPADSYPFSHVNNTVTLSIGSIGVTSTDWLEEELSIKNQWTNDDAWARADLHETLT